MKIFQFSKNVHVTQERSLIGFAVRNFAEVEIFELQMRTERKIFFVMFYSFHHSAHVPCEKFRWRQAKSVSGNQTELASRRSPLIKRKKIFCKGRA